ncbi:MAG: hypothetical protein SHS37scaffold296_26 [Burkholderiales phage 68_11]|jgi:hypothetical protein|nr:MAG: hypothetical protein SHS37scaffold296_26 [Burkholderiales phage 68_11]
MTGLHAPPPPAAPAVLVPLHAEIVYWFSPDTPPDTNRTVIVRIAGLAGTWPAFYDPEGATWFATGDGAEISEPILAWGEQPTGLVPKRPNRAAEAGAIVCRLTKGSHGYGLSFTPLGQQLEAGIYQLQLAAPPNPRSPA